MKLIECSISCGNLEASSVSAFSTASMCPLSRSTAGSAFVAGGWKFERVNGRVADIAITIASGTVSAVQGPDDLQTGTSPV